MFFNDNEKIEIFEGVVKRIGAIELDAEFCQYKYVALIETETGVMTIHFKAESYAMRSKIALTSAGDIVKLSGKIAKPNIPCHKLDLVLSDFTNSYLSEVDEQLYGEKIQMKVTYAHRRLVGALLIMVALSSVVAFSGEPIYRAALAFFIMLIFFALMLMKGFFNAAQSEQKQVSTQSKLGDAPGANQFWRKVESRD